MSDFREIDFFTDQTLVNDPYPYYESLRAQCPVQREPHHGALAVTGYDEVTEVLRESSVFSNCNAPVGPMIDLPFVPEGDDISDLIETHRDQFPMYEHLVTMDQPQHTAHRELLKRLFTPRRLKENEEFMWRLADSHIDRFHATGKVEIMAEYAKPFALLTIADLLGVPEEYHREFQIKLGAQQPGPLDEPFVGNPLEFLGENFSTWLAERRREPRGDVLTSLATGTFPDGTLPEVAEVVHIATFLFAAGQDTTARLLTSALHILAENPELQQKLRDQRELIPTFIEETLRLESPVKADFRLARRTTTVGGVEVPVGSSVMVLLGAANRDPGRFECPAEFRLERPNVREHIAFGRGAHSCPGAPLARVEARVSLERMLDRMGDIRISETEHGPADARRWTYEPTFILRGHNILHLEYTPIG
ncbi:cytochrome P450 [Actinocorallia longicatena]|uniref:Cytochrome P450 n=1 Tax=Actinocorallia longicatena TaxID=111803 RepID=A0ABP6Q4U7_9ACTN